MAFVSPVSLVGERTKLTFQDRLFVTESFYCTHFKGPASVAQLDARPTGDHEVWGRLHSFVEVDREIFSTVILSLPLIQEGQLSVYGERMCTILVNHLED